MKHLRVAIFVAAVCMPASVSAGELVLSFKDGRVTLKATDASLRQILNEWARLGQTRMTGLEKLTGGPLTLELVDVPEKQALEILLRSVAGYIAAPRAVMASASVSAFDRLALLPTSFASAAPMGAARPPAFMPPPPTPFPDPTQLANEEPDPNGSPNLPGIPVFSPNAEPPNPAMVPAGPAGPGQLRGPVPDDPNGPPPIDGAAPGVTAPLTTARPGVIPVPQTPPRP